MPTRMRLARPANDNRATFAQWLLTAKGPRRAAALVVIAALAAAFGALAAAL